MEEQEWLLERKQLMKATLTMCAVAAAFGALVANVVPTYRTVHETKILTIEKRIKEVTEKTPRKILSSG